MDYLNEIRTHAQDPQQIEDLFQNAQRTGKASDFEKAVQASFEADPQNLLFAAWYYRLKKLPPPARKNPKASQSGSWLCLWLC